MEMSKDEVIKGIIHHKLKEKSMQELNHDECFDCPYRPDGKCMCESIEPLLDDALALLKEQEGQVQQWTKEIADNQLAHAPDELDRENWDYKKGIWDGLQIAWNIISEGR